MVKISEELDKDETKAKFDMAGRNAKGRVMSRTYRKILTGNEDGALEDANGDLLEDSILALADTADALANSFDQNLLKFEAFIEECFVFFPKTKTFLKDLCTQTGNQCVRDSTSEHAGCCCLENPVATLAVPDMPDSLRPRPPPPPPARLPPDAANVSPPSPSPPPPRNRRLQQADPTMAAFTEKFDFKLRELQESMARPGAELDVCASAYRNSQPKVDSILENIRDLGQGHLIKNYDEQLEKDYGNDAFPPPPSPPPPPSSFGSSTGINLEKEKEGNPCFPSAATVRKADGAVVRLDALQEGDEVLAATAEGGLTLDTVSIFSLADAAAEATFLSLTTSTNASVTMTPDHHLPIGETCCSRLARAKDVAVGDMVWAVAGSAAVAHRVVATELKIEKGLHSPVLTNGGFPVIDGIVTSFDRIETVALASYLVPYLAPLCKASGTCKLFRRALVAAECGWSSVFGPSYATLACAGATYIDGLKITASSFTSVMASTVTSTACELMGK